MSLNTEPPEDDPCLGFLTGATLKSLNETLLFDDDLEPIRDDELYRVSMSGIHRVPD
jgi:hypothetical protein